MKQLTSQEVAQFASAMEIALSAGMPMMDALSCIYEDATGNLKETIQYLIEQLPVSNSLSKTMMESAVFPDYAGYLCEAGESCGCLDQVMRSLGIYYERDSDLKDQIHQACLYPCFLIGLLLVVMGILITKVLPIFQQVLHSLGSELSSFALTLMNAGSVLAVTGILVLGLLLLLILMVFYLQKHRNTQMLPRLLAKFPLTRRLYSHMAMAQLTYVFSLYISSGIELIDALPSLITFLSHPQIKERVSNCSMRIQTQQESLVQSFRSCKLYQGMEIGMLEIAQTNGSLDEVMDHLAVKYEKQVDQDITDFLNVLEPAILAALSVFVGLVLLSVMLPLMSIMSSL